LESKGKTFDSLVLRVLNADTLVTQNRLENFCR